MAENMEIWDAVKQPPTTALKTIQGGRLKGMTDINPQWRYQVMTEQLGVCGVGWKYEISDLWTMPVNEEQVMVFAKILLYIYVDGVWSEPIPGVGGSMLIAMESGGLHASNEGYKMAITDALSVAMKMLGVGANIYAGLSDSKYSAPPKKAEPAKTKTKTFNTTTIEGALEFLEDKFPKKWGHTVVATRLMDKYGVMGDTMAELIGNLTQEQKDEFTTIISNEVLKANKIEDK